MAHVVHRRPRRHPLRPFLIAAAALVAVAAIAALVVPWLLARRPPLQPGESYGIDVSHHQGTIDWTAVASDGITQAYAKASEGTGLQDGRFVANWSEGRAAGVAMGAYHFFSLCRPGAEQAENFLTVLRTAGALGDGLAPAVDLEFTGNCHGRPTPAALNAELRAFLASVEAATGRTAVLYIFDDFERAYPLDAYGDRPRWVRRLAFRPAGDWTWWQANESASVRGVQGGVDLDVVAAR